MRGRVMKKVLLTLISFTAVLALIWLPVTVCASDTAISFSTDAQSVAGQVMTLTQDTKAFAAADENSEEKATFSKGETVYVVESLDGWYQIFFKGENLYIPAGSFTEEGIASAMEANEELAKEVSKELSQAEKNDFAAIENYELTKMSDRNVLIWKIVIAVLTFAIVAVSIVIGIMNAKSSKESE